MLSKTADRRFFFGPFVLLTGKLEPAISTWPVEPLKLSSIFTNPGYAIQANPGIGMTIAFRSIALVDNAVVSMSVMPSINLTIPVPAETDLVPQTDRKAVSPLIHKDFGLKREAGSEFSNLLECLCDATGNSSSQISTDTALEGSGDSIQQLDDEKLFLEAYAPGAVPQVIAEPPVPDPNFGLPTPASSVSPAPPVSFASIAAPASPAFSAQPVPLASSVMPDDPLSGNQEGLLIDDSEHSLFSENGTRSSGRIRFPGSGTEGETKPQVKIPEHPGLQPNNADTVVEPVPQFTLPTNSQPVTGDKTTSNENPEPAVVSTVSATHKETGADSVEDSSHSGESTNRNSHSEIADAIKVDVDSKKRSNPSFNPSGFEILDSSTDQSVILPGLDTSIKSTKGSSGTENAPAAFSRFAALQPDARVSSPGTYDSRDIDPVSVLRQVSDAPAVRAGIEKINVLDESTVRLELNPSRLGELTIEIKRTESVIKVYIVADRVETHAILERNIESLIQAFREGGGTKVDVDVSQHQSNHSRQGSGQETAGQGLRRSQVAGTPAVGRARSSSISENSVDIYV